MKQLLFKVVRLNNKHNKFFSIKRGATRIVFIFKGFAIKIPVFYRWKNLLLGLLANLNEKEFSTLKREDLAHVFFCSLGGMILIMKTATPISHLTREELFDFLTKCYENDELKEFILSDFKLNNFGLIGNKIVKIDYGN